MAALDVRIIGAVVHERTGVAEHHLEGVRADCVR
ncbi:hypothetical protein ACVWWN_003398 [Mycobacterium sp. URHB0021]